MDPRCLRNLKSFPKKWCPLAVIRLKALRNCIDSEEKVNEEDLPGCPYAIASQTACFCFWKYMKYCSSPNMSDAEIANLLLIPIEEVKKIEKRAISKLKRTDFYKECKKNN